MEQGGTPELNKIYRVEWAGTKEARSRNLRDTTTEVLRDNQPITIQAQGAHGEDLIFVWANYYVLTKLCQEEGIDPANIHLQFRDYKHNPKFDLSKQIENAMGTHIDASRANFFHANLHHVGRALGIALTQEDDMHIPQPVKIDKSPLQTFDREQVIREGESLRQQHSQIVTISQAGGKPEKAFTNEQVSFLARIVRDSFPDSHIVILSDYAIPADRNEVRIKPDVNNGNEVVTSSDINAIAAHFYATDLLIAVDTFWGWLGTGSMVMRPERAGRLGSNEAIILHTSFNSGVWGISGANIVDSEVLEYKRAKRGRNDFSSIDPTDYQSYYASKRIASDVPLPELGNFYASARNLPRNIHDNDIGRLVNEVKNVAKTAIYIIVNPQILRCQRANNFLV